MRLTSIELVGFKSFAKKTDFLFDAPVVAVVGPNGSGKSNVAEAFRWVLGERSIKSLRGARGEDLIWNGGGGPVGAAPRASRAAVTLMFDNSDRRLPVDFSGVSITREVFRDGTNNYYVNGSAVRFRDLLELLHQAGLAAPEHFIVSQGEADRVLRASPAERRGLVEDALGLRLYQWKIEDSQRKMEKTREHMAQVASLRRELAPHLKFLARQVEKAERAAALRAQLKTLYLDYLSREAAYVAAESRTLGAAIKPLEAELGRYERELGADGNAGAAQAALDAQERQLRAKKDEVSRRLGRVEALLEVKREAPPEPEITHTAAEVKNFGVSLEGLLHEADSAPDLDNLRGVISRVRALVHAFFKPAPAGDNLHQRVAEELGRLAKEKEELECQLEELAGAEAKLAEARTRAAQDIARHYESKSRVSELTAELNTLRGRQSKLRLEEENFKRECAEAVVLVGEELRRIHEGGAVESDRALQESRRRELEKIKIRLEDMGVESGDVLREYKETTERDAHLARELTDLEASAASLRQIIDELRQKIDSEFAAGLGKINDHFQNFFALMFGGGAAELKVVKEKKVAEDDSEAALELGQTDVGEAKGGLDIAVNLPRKRIRNLDMLSGGERALVSIAFLFAISQVNPPPFLILDETDAALDEANSRKYGEMVDNLAAHSQLILVTHNRETMSRAKILYGVTMGADGVSRLLSIRLEEATQYAK